MRLDGGAPREINGLKALEAQTGLNPVIESSLFVCQVTAVLYLTTSDLVELNETGMDVVVDMISRDTPAPPTGDSWRSHPLHFLPPRPYDPKDPRTTQCLDWIFLVSALNFSFWSPLPEQERFGVEWYTDGFDAISDAHGPRETKKWTGYWSLLAGIDKALEARIPITSPAYFASCSLSTLNLVFAPPASSQESMALLPERTAILREVGSILLEQFGGSFAGLLEIWETRHGPERTALQLVQMVIEAFPSFRDEANYQGRQLQFWKRAQILVAETWAAFQPDDPTQPHPIFPRGVDNLTMFADYRVPAFLHSLGAIRYAPSQLEKLLSGDELINGSAEEVSLRAAGVLAVEVIKTKLNAAIASQKDPAPMELLCKPRWTSVDVDFWLWDAAKRYEALEHRERRTTDQVVHRTRSIWY